MMGYSVDTAVGRVVTGEIDSIFRPRTPRKGTVGVVLCHGSDQPTNFIDLTAQPSSVKLAAAFAASGIPCIAGVFHGNSWGNANSMADIDNAATVLRAQFPDLRTDKIALLGISMGGAVAIRYSQLNPTKTAAVIGLIPAVDPKTLYDNNIFGLKSVIATAWGQTTSDPFPSALDLMANASLAADIPFLAGYSTVDAIIDSASVISYAAAVGGQAIVTDTTFGHSDAAVGGMPISTMGVFLRENGA